VRDRKLPTLRTYAEKYIRMMPDLVRADGLGWAFGRAAGAYGQMHCVSLILQGLRDGWIPDDQKAAKYFDILRRLFLFFYQTYLDQEQGFLDLRDDERTAYKPHTTRMANFDAARYLCQWSRLDEDRADAPGAPWSEPPKTSGRFVIFDKATARSRASSSTATRSRACTSRCRSSAAGAPLERRPPLPPLPRASSTGRTTSTCRSCCPSSPSAST
jgi:hypothetical protein